MSAANWWTIAYEEKIKIAGIVYLHRNENVRLGGAAMRNLSMFKKLYGDSSLASVVLDTIRRRNVEPDDGLRREQQLCSDPKMWKCIIDFGKLVDNNKDLNETAAGQELHAEVEKQKTEYERQIAALRQEMEDAMTKMNEDLKILLQAEKDDLERRLREAREHDHQLEVNREEIRQKMACEV
ncbi:hypothetical protein FB567DRAFT_626311 [Paraphoma chrysanthemicola]|uniref:Uncharacterized protein n=1 Tax=Paraphoma chrysanthemicola TaxID=798071 RepID=A0A8K0W1S0_9PLEO|nr:hypothetical protein FB567DRAFT_626311 [Paraphoma chrysanthemicola]